MRFLGIGDYCDLGSMYMRLQCAGHEVKVFIREPLCHTTMGGIIERVEDWQSQLGWVKEARNEGFVLFENVANHNGELQDDLRKAGFNVIGGSAFGDRLENERAFAQGLMAQAGLSIAKTIEFCEERSAVQFVHDNPARYVLKFNGDGFGSADNYVGKFADGMDVVAMISAKYRQCRDGNGGDEKLSFILMEFVEGIEMGVGAYFNGEAFLTPACLDWEHKPFFPGDLGELTGEMGTVATFDYSGSFFDKTLARFATLLRKNGYQGYINLNTIVNSDGIWPLEFTCRFGYPGYAVLEPLQITAWDELFKMLVSRTEKKLQVRSGFCTGVVMTTRPFPYVRTYIDEPIGLPICFNGPMTKDDFANLHYAEMQSLGGQLATAGYHGWTMVVTGAGGTIQQACFNAYALAKRVTFPNMRYRNDIGAKLIASDFERLRSWGYVV